MGCQKDVANKSVTSEEDYVFGLKGNQETLHDDVRVYFGDAMKTPQFYDGISNHRTIEKGHGRFEKRYCSLSEDINWLPQKTQWLGLKPIGMVRPVVGKSRNTTEEVRYFIFD